MSFIYKPETRKGPVFLSSSEGSGPPVITLPNGQTYQGVRGDRVGGTYFNEGNFQWVFPNQVLGVEGATISHGGQTGKLGNSNMSYRGDSLSNWQESSKGAVGSGGMGGAGGLGAFAPGQIGFGSFPANISGMYPNPVFGNFSGINQPKPLNYKATDYNPFKYTPMDTAPYEFTDPTKFATDYAKNTRGQLSENAGASSAYAKQSLDTELQGLKNFAPAAAAVQRSEVSLDNQFNQSQRTQQVNTALPGVESDLAAQRDRANAYAEGRLPSGIEDANLEAGIRSRSADFSTSGGFGASSGAGRKAGDLMSAEQRLQIAQMGEGLLTQNIGNRANLFLAPTEYSNAGNQIRVMPTLSGSQLAADFFSQANQLGILPAATALSSKINQNQFQTQLEQGNRQFNTQTRTQVGEFNTSNKMNTDQFNQNMKYNYGTFNTQTAVGVGEYNASNNFQESLANANIANSFSTGLFGYNAGYAASVAGAAQTNTNTQVGLAQQAQAQQVFGDNFSRAQNAGTAGAVAQGIGAIPGIVSAGAQLLSSLGFGGGSSSGGAGTVPSLTSPGQSNAPSPEQIAGGISPGSSTPDFTFSPTNPNSGVMNPPTIGVAGGVSGGVAGTPVNSSPAFTGASLPDFQSPLVAPSGDVQAFTTATDSGGIFKSLQNDPQQVVTRSLMQATANSVNATAGVYPQPQPGLVPGATQANGAPTYVSPVMQASTNTNAGNTFVSTLGHVLDPLGVFSSEDASALNKVAAGASDAALLEQLNAQHEQGDTKGFVNTVLGRFGLPAVQSLTNDPKNQSGIAAGYAAYNLLQNWDQMGPAQKTLGLAAIGLHGYKFGTGEDLAGKFIIKPESGNAGLTVGQGLNLFAAGYNVYSLAKNWGQLNNVQKLTYGTGTAAQVATTARQFGMLGAGEGGAAVQGVSAAKLAAQGWSSTPNFGIGAVTSETGQNLPAGYTAISRGANGQVTAVPAANATSASPFWQGVGQVGGAITLAAGAKQVYDGWGKGDGTARGAVNGAVGGSAVYAGMATFGATNPYVGAAIIAASIYGNTYEGNSNSIKANSNAMSAFKKAGGPANPVVSLPVGGVRLAVGTFEGGKSQDQMGRDSIRSQWKETGLTDSKHQVTLSDGSQFNVGMDGKNAKHEFTNTDLIPKGNPNRSLNAWDVDYTNDLDYSASLGATTLSRLLGGGINKQIDQMGGQLTNAAIGNIGYNKALTPDTFNTMTANLRSFYSQTGVKTKADAYQLINQGFAEGRWNESDALGMHNSVDIVFDNNFSTTKKLLEGRFKGIELAGTGQASQDTTKAPSRSPMHDIDPGFTLNADKFPNAGNFAKVSSGIETLPRKVTGYNPVKLSDAVSKIASNGLTAKTKTLNLSKGAIRLRNKERYASSTAMGA